MSTFRLIEADCIEAMSSMDEASVDAIVTDPPYGLEFMGKEWDRLEPNARWGADHEAKTFSEANGIYPKARNVAGPQNRPAKNPRCRTCGKHRFSGSPCECVSPDWDSRGAEQGAAMQRWHQAWATQALRVLKPGGHLLAFGGTRTYHRLTCALEDAGFEIRDCLAWLYGSGFPKSLDVSKAIDKAAPRAGMFEAFAAHFQERRAASGLSRKEVAKHFPSKTGGLTGCVFNWEKGLNVPTMAQWEILAPMLDLSDEWLPLIERVEAEREVVAQREAIDIRNGHGRPLGSALFAGVQTGKITLDITEPATDEAQRWQGWGTALKPAFEPIVLARKPLIGSVARNVQEFGTGALNIDGTRIGTDDTRSVANRQPARKWEGGEMPMADPTGSASGRWPANVILGHSPDCKPTGKTRKVAGDPRPSQDGSRPGGFFDVGSDGGDGKPAGPLYGETEVEVWDCTPDCPVAMLDEQSGERRSAGLYERKVFGSREGPASIPLEGGAQYADAGGASRFFKVVSVGGGERSTWASTERDPSSTFYAERFMYIPKADREERNRGLGHLEPTHMRRMSGGEFADNSGSHNSSKNGATSANHHPTVKPVELMQWLVRLVCPPGGVVLDPFTGSGSTGMAALREGFDFIGIERESEYVEIARARIIGDGPLLNVEAGT